MSNIEITPLAREDISDILTYTQANFGEEQRITYRELIFTTIEKIAQHPAIGHHRPDMPPAYRAFNCGKHLIIYTKRDDIILIARILHSAMDFRRQIPPDLH